MIEGMGAFIAFFLGVPLLAQEAHLAPIRPIASTIEPLATQGLEMALGKALIENPIEASRIEARVNESSYGASLGGADWKPELALAFGPRLTLRATESGFADAASFSQFLASEAPQARLERASLLKTLLHSPRGEEWTSLFRDESTWKKPLEDYLDKLIAARKSRQLNLKSVGAAYGSEAYTLAIMVDRALRRAREDPTTWGVTIQAYDASPLSVLAAGRGVFRLTERDEDAFRRNNVGEYFEGPKKGVYQLKPELRRWIKPVYVDLDDVAQHPIVLDAPADVVFANHVLANLRAAPASLLAHHWMSDRWSKQGFLSMAPVVVGMTGPSTEESQKLENSLLAQFNDNVGFAGRAFYGDSFLAPGAVSRVWREFWRSRSAEGRRTLTATHAFNAKLHADPFHVAELNPTALDLLKQASHRGVEVRLTNEAMTAHYAAKENRLYVGVGSLLAPNLIAALSGWISEELLGAPKIAQEVARLTASSVQGAPLTIEVKNGATILRWLTRTFTPLTVSFPNPEEISRQTPSSTPRNSGVYGLN